MEIRISCENCDKALPNGSQLAMICSLDCTFCKDCVENLLKNVCPNCGGGFEKRPTRPKHFVGKYPPLDKRPVKPVNFEKFQVNLNEYKDIEPSKR